uniref:Uncharacterized protein n=1 Tax=Ixodes ricinus TaxID=34613 RepID=A0A6B0U1R7_IXORI
MFLPKNLLPYCFLLCSFWERYLSEKIKSVHIVGHVGFWMTNFFCSGGCRLYVLGAYFCVYVFTAAFR